MIKSLYRDHRIIQFYGDIPWSQAKRSNCLQKEFLALYPAPKSILPPATYNMWGSCECLKCSFWFHHRFLSFLFLGEMRCNLWMLRSKGKLRNMHLQHMQVFPSLNTHDSVQVQWYRKEYWHYQGSIGRAWWPQLYPWIRQDTAPAKLLLQHLDDLWARQVAEYLGSTRGKAIEVESSKKREGEGDKLSFLVSTENRYWFLCFQR